ncbi:hypothetical protein ACSLVQ_28755, partial [Klebsiella pneumoniae]|uniref:hypothetical protein n=1 Tax=Klebsiella pneumoniae TaxID=573 RepID=UPI003EE2454C
FTHLYLQPNEAGFQAWSKHRDANDLWGEPQVVDPFTQSELLSYLDEIDQSVFTFMDRVDLDAPDCGFYWYSMSKIEHLLVNLRHISC